MNKKKLTIIIASTLAAVAMLGGGFLLGAKYAPAVTGVTGAASVAGAPGGPFGDMTDEERAEFEAMTDEERQAYMEENGMAGRGDGTAPTGTVGQGGPGAGASGVEGTVSSLESDKFTVTISSGGSSVFYLDEDTIVAAPESATPTIAEGVSVIVYGTPEADGVTAADTVVVLAE